MRHLSFLAFGVVAACSNASAPSDARRTDSAGVELVQNIGPDRALHLSASPTDTLFDPATDTVLQGEAQKLQIGADAEGRIVFADGARGDRHVLRRERDGTYRQIGGHGGGPGEYGLAGGIGVAPSGEVLVVDYTKEGYLRFDPDGRPLPLLPWSAIGKGFARTGGYFAGGLVAQLTDMGAGDGEASGAGGGADSDSPRTTQRLFLLLARDTVQVAELREPPMKMARYEGCGVGYAQPPLFFPSLLWSGNATMLAVVSDGGYQIDVWRDGRLVRRIRRASTPRTVTESLAERELSPGLTITFGPRAPCLIAAPELVEKQGFAPALPAIRRLTMAEDGTLWVERWTLKGEPRQRDLFGPTGAYLGTLTGDMPWPDAWLPDGRFLSISGNADSLPVVVRYAVGGGVRGD